MWLHNTSALTNTIAKMNGFMCGTVNGAFDACPIRESMLNITLVAPWAAYPPVLQSLTHGMCARRHLHTLAQRLHTFSTGVYVGAITLRGLGVVGGALDCALAPTAFAMCRLPSEIVAPASNNDGGDAPYAP